jgi:hypothetical protein
MPLSGTNNTRERPPPAMMCPVVQEPNPVGSRPTDVHRIRLVSAAALLLLCAACGDNTSAGHESSASCVGPYLNDQPPSGVFRGPVPTVSPGDSIKIYGHWYTETCNDTGGQGQTKDPLVPMPPVHLTLVLPGGAVEALGEFSPEGRDMGFSSEVHVPAGTPVGTATVHDDRQYPAAFKFKVGQ